MIDRLGNHVSIVGGGTPSRKVAEYWGGPIPWATVKDLNNGFELSSTQETITEEGVHSSATRILPQGTLITATRMALGKAVIATRPLAINQDLKGLLCASSLDTRYLLYFLHSKAQFLEGLGKGATVKGILIGDLQDLEIPLPDLAEQKRIAAILDKADAIRRKRQQALTLTDDLLRSTFLDMFGDPATNPKGWDQCTIGDLVEEVKYGSSKKAGPEGEWPMLRMNNITPTGGWDFSDLKYLNLEEKEIPKYTVQKGDLLFNRTNSKELVGKTAVYREEEPMAYAGYLIRVRGNELADTEYISAYLNSEHGKATLMGMCKAIIGMANINAKELQGIRILKPPVGLQREYASFVRAFQKRKKTMESYRTEADLLFDSCLQRAFRGEL